MDVNAQTIEQALAAGAAVAAKDTGAQAIKDCYRGLRALVERAFAGKPAAETALAQHEQAPETWQKPLQKELQQAGVDQEPDVVASVQRLYDALQTSANSLYVQHARNITNIQNAHGPIHIGDNKYTEELSQP
jgi:hypothetical protein